MISPRLPGLSIGIIGGGFVGITLAAHLLHNSQNKVTLIEREITKVNDFLLGNYQVFEPELDGILDAARNDGRLLFNSESAEMLDCVFISVGTPKGLSSAEQLEMFQSIIFSVSNQIKNSGLIFLRSTVSLGTTERLAAELAVSDRKDLSIFFAPERTAEGNAIHELRTLPQVIGGTKENISSGISVLQDLGFKTVECSNSKVAEMVKLTCNTWRDTIFAYANEIAAIADFEGIDGYEVIKNSNLDYIRGGIPLPGPVGGPCLTKDTHILLSDKPYAENSMILAGRKINENLIFKVCDYIMAQANKQDNFTIEFLGAAFKGKPFTNDVRDGIADQVIKTLEAERLTNLIFWITDDTLGESDLLHLKSFWHGPKHPDVVNLVLIGHNGQFISEQNSIEYLSGLSSDVTIVDLWGFTRNLMPLKANVVSMGSGKFL